MKYRLATLWPRTQYAADKVETIDIDVIDPISRLVVTAEVDSNTGGSGSSDGHPAKAISKIELVDGSNVLFSLTGQESQGVDFYDREKVCPNFIMYLNGMYSEQIFNMNFGRKLFDPDLALDPKKFRNPQLKITIDVGAGGWNNNDVYLTVLGHLFDEKQVTPIGFLMNKEIKDYTMGSASHEYTDLPTDFPYRQLFLRPQVYGTGPEGVVDIVKLSEDVDKKVPLNHTMYQILRNMLQEWAEYEEALICTAQTTAIYAHCTPCYFPFGAASGWSSDPAHAYAQMYAGDGGRALIDASVTGRNVLAKYHGWAPHAMVPLLPRAGDDYNDWYDFSKVSNLKLDVLSTSGQSGSTQIITQQLRKY
jgi:hypothetical protein